MADHSDELPETVRQAQETVDGQQKAMMRMMGGVMAIMIAVLVLAGVGAPDGGIISMIAIMMAWILGNIGMVSRSATEAARAQNILKEWDRQAIADELGTAGVPVTTESAATEPDDPRWQAVITLLGRIRELAGDDAHTIEVAEEVKTKLRGLIEDQATLVSAIEADRALGGDSESARARSQRLENAMKARSATAERLVEAIRDLHVELAVRDASADPIVDRLEALLDQVEAEAEVASVGSGEREEKARMAQAQKMARTRE